MKKVIFLFIIFLSCKSQNDTTEIIINSNFQKIITNYSDSNPIQILRFISSEEELIFPQPSYHIFFDKKDTDTIMSIKLLPHLSNFNPINFEKQGDSVTIYSEINPTGYFMIENKPIIIYDLDNYSRAFIRKDKLLAKIPDSLKFEIGKANNHIKSHTEYYKVSKLDFENISWEEIHK
jgi:hypothetical protein